MKNIYDPIPVIIKEIKKYSGDVKLFRLKRKDGKKFPVETDGMVFYS